MKSISSIFFGLMLVITIFYSMQIIGNNSIDNSNLDQSSVNLIGNFSNNLDNNLDYNTDFNDFNDNLSSNSSFDSADVFAQEYLEGKSQGAEKQGVISSITKIPDLVILSLGIDQNKVAWIKGIILLIITTLLGFAAYRAAFGGGKISDN